MYGIAERLYWLLGETARYDRTKTKRKLLPRTWPSKNSRNRPGVCFNTDLYIAFQMKLIWFCFR